MLSVKVTLDLNERASRVWERISDVKNVYLFHPMVHKSPLLSENNQGLGAKRQCHFYDKSSVIEEITQWEEGKLLTVRLTETTAMPLKSAEVTFHITPTGENMSTISMEMNFVVKYGPIGWMMGIMMMKPMMRKLFTKILKGLEYHLATGKTVDEKWKPDKELTVLKAAS